jgi:hypothetical protein
MIPTNASLTAICACSSVSAHANDASRYLLEKKLSEWLISQSIHQKKSSIKDMDIQVLLGTDRSCGSGKKA